jgi:diacylglycerol kinase
MIKSRVRSLGHAIRGILFCAGNEVNFRIEIFSAVAVIAAGMVLACLQVNGFALPAASPLCWLQNY